MGVVWRSALGCGMEIVVDFGKMGKTLLGFVWERLSLTSAWRSSLTSERWEKVCGDRRWRGDRRGASCSFMVFVWFRFW